MSNNQQSARLPFLAFTSDGESIAVLKQFIVNMGWEGELILEGDITTATDYLKSHPSPVVLCVDIANAETAPAALDKLADVCDPDIKVIVSGKINEYSFYCWLVEVGIANYLLKPFILKALETAFHKVSETPHHDTKLTTTAKNVAKVITVIGSRGGVGASTVSVNLAWLLANQFKQKTALLDFDPQLGTVSLAFDLEPARGLRDVLEKPDRIDGLFLERVMVKVDDYLSILSTEEPLEEIILPEEAAAEAMLFQIKQKFSHIIIDLPLSLTPFTRYALQHADHVLCVTEYSIAGLRDSLRILEYCRDILKVPAPIFIANRVGMAGKHQVPQAEFEKGLGEKMGHIIPLVADAYACATAGEILAETSKNNPATKVLTSLAARFVESTENQTAATKKGVFDFLKGGK